MTDPYDDQLKAARYRAERDQARQELARLMGEATTMSAYDLLPDEDREALRWVRKKGGLDAVRQRWERLSCYADNVPRSCMEKRLARLQRQVDESHAALRRRNQRIALLESETNRAHNENRMEFLRREGNYTAFADEVCKRLAPQLRYTEGCTKDVMDAALEALDSRLMPEGMGWLLDVWPRFEDDTPVRFLDDFERYGEENGVSTVTMCSDGSYALNFRAYSKDERVRRAPVLAADGEPLEAGQTVWEVATGERYTVVEIYHGTTEPNFPLHCVKCERDGDVASHMFEPSQLTHTKPEPPDSWERIEEDLGDEMAKQQCGPISPELACKLAGEFVRRCKALAERGE